MRRGECYRCNQDVELDADDRPVEHFVRVQSEDCRADWFDGPLCCGTVAYNIYETGEER